MLHAKNIAKGKSSPAYWANKTKWATGGSVELEDLDEKYEGIKKPDFKLLESFRDLIRTLQERAADSGTQEFDPVRALGRSGAAGSLEDLYEAYSDKPAPHASRAEAGAEPATDADIGGISPAADAALAALRSSWSGPEFNIISGYRDPETNKRVGGAEGSQHLHGNAFDVNTAGWTPEEKLALADAAYDAGFRGFGFYNNNLHFDVATPRAWGPSYKRESVPLWAQDWVSQRFAEGGRVKRDPEMTEAEIIEGMFKSEDGIDRLNDYMRKISRAGTVGKQAGRLTGIPLGGNIGRLIAEAIAEEQFSQEQGFAEGGLAELTQKYAPGGDVKKSKKDELADMERQIAEQMQGLYEEDLALRGGVPRERVVPVKPGMLDLGYGTPERLALVNQTLNPVEAIGDAMEAGRDLMASDADGYQRLEALGRMLSGVAGVAGPAAVAKRVGTPAAAAVMEGLTGGAPAANAAPFGKDWSDVYHWSRSPDDFSEFDLSQSKSAMSQLGPHVGTPQAAEARYMGFAKPEGVPPALGFTLPMKADLSKPFLNPVTGKPWTEMDLEMFISAVSDANNIERRLVAPFMRERLAKEGYTSIPYMNDVEDTGSISHIMLTDRPSDADAVLRSRFAKFDPAMRNARNISAGVAAGAIGASQYNPDAIEARANKIRKNEFAAGGAVKYDPSAVDRIINQLREVNRG